jgi:hypothetical protein
MGSATQARVEQPDAVAYKPFAPLGKVITFDVFLGQIANDHIDVGIIELGGHQQFGSSSTVKGLMLGLSS